VCYRGYPSSYVTGAAKLSFLETSRITVYRTRGGVLFMSLLLLLLRVVLEVLASHVARVAVRLLL
jgi:hypothetical protein